MQLTTDERIALGNLEPEIVGAIEDMNLVLRQLRNADTEQGAKTVAQGLRTVSQRIREILLEVEDVCE